MTGHRDGAAVAVLTLSSAVRIYLATGATDLRRSIEGSSRLQVDLIQAAPSQGSETTGEAGFQRAQVTGHAVAQAPEGELLFLFGTSWLRNR